MVGMLRFIHAHFKRCVGLGVCAYNLHKIGAELLRIEREKELKTGQPKPANSFNS